MEFETGVCECLHHYTSGSAMLAIIKDRILWASDASYLNDFQELQMGIDLLAPIYDDLHGELAQDEQYQYEDNILRSRADNAARLAEFVRSGGRSAAAGRPHVFVTCFSQDGDALSQWRAYGNNGYALGFDRQELKKCRLEGFAPRDNIESQYEGIRPPLELVQVEYVADEQPSTLDADTVRAIKDEVMGGIRGVHMIRGDLDALRRLASIKHIGFAEEKESRLIYTMRSDRGYVKENGRFRTLIGEQERYGPTLNFRDSALSLIPYIELGFPAQALEHIVVGPGDMQELRAEAVERLLNEWSIDAEVRLSRTPYRSR